MKEDLKEELRREIVWFSKLMYERGYIVASDGNMSARINENLYLITPSGKRKGELKVSQILLVNNHGTVIEGNLKPSIEMWMHIWIYEVRPDVNAIVHGHPPYATAFSFQMPREYEPLVPEIKEHLGSFGFVPYRPPGSRELAELVKEKCKDHNVLILHKHGVVTLGENLEDAFNRLERLEFELKVRSLRSTFH